MSHAVAVLATIIGMSFVVAISQIESDKRTEQAGYMIIGKNTYRLVSVSTQ